MQMYYNTMTQERETAKTAGELALKQQEARKTNIEADIAELGLRQKKAYLWGMAKDGDPVAQRLYDEMFGGEAPPVPAPTNGGDGENSGQGKPVSDASSQEIPSTNVDKTAPQPTPTDAVIEGEKTTQAIRKDAQPELQTGSAYSNLPNEYNPDYWTAQAEAQAQKIAKATFAGMPTAEYETARDVALKKAEYLRGFAKDQKMLTPEGIKPLPGAQEAEARQSTLTTTASGAAQANIDTDNQISALNSDMASRSMVIDGLRDTLKTTETGKFTEFKTDLVNALASLGIASADQVREAGDAQTAMKYFAQSILDSGVKDKIGPQISNADLELVKRGTGSVEQLALANRNILGAMAGKRDYDRAKINSWNDFVKSKGGIENIKSDERRQWLLDFDKGGETVMKIVLQGKANTPVAGELSTKQPNSYFHEGWQYVAPNGLIFVYKTKKVNGKKVPAPEYVQ
jgi:hypothetical protein